MEEKLGQVSPPLQTCSEAANPTNESGSAVPRFTNRDRNVRSIPRTDNPCPSSVLAAKPSLNKLTEQCSSAKSHHGGGGITALSVANDNIR